MACASEKSVNNDFCAVAAASVGKGDARAGEGICTMRAHKAVERVGHEGEQG